MTRPRTTTESGTIERRSPLDAVHRAAGASFTDFAGWQMPVRYSSDLAEHHAVRTLAGLFDLSHMGEIVLLGPEAGRGARLRARRQALGDRDRPGEVLAAARRGRRHHRRPRRLPHRRRPLHGRRERVERGRRRRRAARARRRRSTRSSPTRATTSRSSRCRAPTRARCCSETPGLRHRRARATTTTTSSPRSRALKYYRAFAADFEGEPVLVARTGYTGEDGFELYVAPDRAAGLWDALRETGGPRVVPCGLASRDTLRLEAGMPLYGHELEPRHPARAGRPRPRRRAREGGRLRRSRRDRAGPSRRMPRCSSASPQRAAAPPAPTTRCTTATARMPPRRRGHERRPVADARPPRGDGVRGARGRRARPRALRRRARHARRGIRRRPPFYKRHA